MAKVQGRPNIDLKVTIELNESEARALEALFDYDVQAFLDTFYEKMGRSYLEPHEDGLRSLHSSRGFLAHALRKVDEARKTFDRT